MTSASPYTHYTDTVFDIVVFGAGYAGFAATQRLVSQGKSVLLIDRRGAALSESGWSFEGWHGQSQTPEWLAWQKQLLSHNAADATQTDGGSAEVLANQWIVDQRASGHLQVLYFAAPLAVEQEDGLLQAVLLGTKSGLERVAARQWVDATSSGELQRLLVPGWETPAVREERVHIYLQSQNWGQVDAEAIGHLVPGWELLWRNGFWEEERCLSIITHEAVGTSRSRWIPALRAVREAAPDALAGAVVSHGSVEPYALYAQAPAPVLPANVVAANPWLTCGPNADQLAGRFELGLAAASQLATAATVNPTAGVPFHGEIEAAEQACGIAVAGLGTGGAVAAIAAARQGGQVLAFDPMPFCGGIGAGGGIHVYYYGVRGGLQEELDARIRAVMPLFGARGQIQGFHPDAKKCVLEELLLEAGGKVLYGASLISVESEDGVAKSALLSTEQGPLRLNAEAWIDATGDGDLCARAGAAAQLGREGDGMPHAYSQSSGRLSLKETKLVIRGINYDAGFTDPTDAADLTRARLVGISHYWQPQFSHYEHPTYIAPAIGLRQSRHIDTDYTLQLEDQVFARRFPDTVGFSGCHYDNHASDYEMESLEGAFLVWVCRSWQHHMAHEIPYRILLPAALKNVWLACRALGVSQDAHHSLRMQRDMQRIGEVAGLAATLAPSGKSRAVDLAQLQQLLRESGALDERPTEKSDFGSSTANDALLHSSPEDHVAWLASLETEKCGLDPFKLYRAGLSNSAVRSAVVERMDSTHQTVAWRSTAIAAMWGEAAAEAVLLKTIEGRHTAEDATESTNRTAPRWLTSLVMLRPVITLAALPVLAELAAEANVPHSVRVALAQCVAALAARADLTGPDKDLAVATLELLLATPAPNSVVAIQRPGLQMEFSDQSQGPLETRIVREDLTWQLHLSVASARQALGLEPQAAALSFLQDDRVLVRRALGQVLAPVA